MREKISLFTFLIYVLGLLLPGAGVFSKHAERQSANIIARTTFNTQDKVEASTISFLAVSLEQTLISRCQLKLMYGRQKLSNMFVPLSASSSVSGFVIGTDWKPASIKVYANQDDRFTYAVSGTMEWKLFNVKLYSQSKYYSGSTPVKSMFIQ